jgi:hypothetical protein
MNLVVLGLVLLGWTVAGFVGLGALHDVRERNVERRLAAARRALASVLFEDEETAAHAFPVLLQVPRSLLLDLVQNVAVDLGAAAQERLRGIVLDAHLARRIHLLQRRRSWRRRVQAAHLQHLLPDDDPRRTKLFDDPHPLVRARAAESLPREDVVVLAERLLHMLDDPVHTVRVGAQQALLRADARIAEPLCEYLWGEPGLGTSLALEVAANLPDPRYGPVIVHHAADPDSVRRAMVARALGAGTALESAATLTALLRDTEADVRAAAAHAVASVGATELVGTLGEMLSDPSWVVRREAGRALDALGAPGAVVLRAHLFDEDRYARDMAKQILDAAAARHRMPAVIVPEALPPLDEVIVARGAR